jgi:hypothetical protein
VSCMFNADSNQSKKESKKMKQQILCLGGKLAAV